MNVEFGGVVHENARMSYLGWQLTRCGHPYYLTEIAYLSQEPENPEVPLAKVVEKPCYCLECIAWVSEFLG